MNVPDWLKNLWNLLRPKAEDELYKLALEVLQNLLADTDTNKAKDYRKSLAYPTAKWTMLRDARVVLTQKLAEAGKAKNFSDEEIVKNLVKAYDSLAK